MALIIADRVREVVSLAGTGNVPLLGVAPVGFQSFVAAVGEGNTTYYAIVSVSGQWETGLGTITSGQLVRTEVYDSSTGSKVDFTSGSKEVFCTPVAAKQVVLNPDGTLTVDVVGNASTATTLQTARTIGGVSFNGAANIDLPGVNTAGNQDTSGNAASATVLQTARTIGGVSFNGSANIDLPGVNTAGNQDTSGNAATVTNGVYTTGDQTIDGTKTFSEDIVGSVTGNAAGTELALAASTGATLVGADDAASGSLFTTVQGFITRLRSSVGAALVGFIQAGTGAVARTLQDKLRSLPADAADYGALPNSGVDEWANLNNAMQAHKEVQLEEGVYLVTRGLRQTLNGAKIRGRGKDKTIIRAISPAGDGKFGGTNGAEAVLWAMAPEGAPLFGLSTEDLTIDCNGLMTGLVSGDVRLKGHHYMRVHDFDVSNVKVKECGSYAFWANDKTIESGGTITGCAGEYNDCEAVDSEISFETTGRCYITYNRPRATQTRTSWDWPIYEVYHFYGGDGLITVNDGYAKCNSSTVIGPLLTQKNVIFNGGHYEQLNAGTTSINMGTPTGNYDNWVFNDVVMLAAGALGSLSFGGLSGINNKLTIKGGRWEGQNGVGPTFTANGTGYGSVDMIGVDCSSTTTGGAVPFSLIVSGTFKHFHVVGGRQSVYGPSAGSSPVNAASVKFTGTTFLPTSSVTATIRQSYRASAAFANAGGFAQINFAIPLNPADISKVVVSGAVRTASGTNATGAGEGVSFTWNNPSGNILNILAPSAAVGLVLSYEVVEYE